MKIYWSNYEWIPQERWGEIHPDKNYCWYDPSCVHIDEYEYLHLETKYNPKYFDQLKHTSTIGVGLVSCTEKFKHGIFEIDARLPSGKNLWPAFWMWSWDDWPPEIDILEGYTGFKGTYFKMSLFGLWNVQSNVHYSKDGVIGSAKGKNTWWFLRNPSKNFIKYKLDWNKNYIKFYYNDILVREIVDRSILDMFNETTMNVIINNHVDVNVDKTNPPKSDFIIKNFKYIPHII